jgi:hypothetical protein
MCYGPQMLLCSGNDATTLEVFDEHTPSHPHPRKSSACLGGRSLRIQPVRVDERPSEGSLSWKCRRHVVTCRRRHNVSLQFWPDVSVSPTQNWRCCGSLCRLEPTFTRFSEFVCRNILWYGSTYAQIPNAHFCHVLVLSCSGGVTTHTHPTPTRIENTHNSHNE